MERPDGTVLVVDDNPINRKMLEKSVSRAGFGVTGAANGQDALAKMRVEAIDVVLLDLVMPGMHGIDVLTRLKEDPELKHIPVIIVSGISDMTQAIDCIKLGALDFLPKPADPILLKARLDASMREKSLRDAEQAYTDALEQQNEELDAFAQTVAHDLKSPLAGMLIRAEYLTMLDDQSLVGQRARLGQILAAGFKMQTIIEELLLLARVRKEEIEVTPLRMGAIVANMQSRLEHTLSQHEPELVLPPVWPVAVGYAPWVEEVWANYTTNALKYGGDPPRLEFGATPAGNGVVRFWLRDNGPGLRPDEKKKLFVPFSRVGDVKTEGQGLGLSIVRRIITRMNGQVGVDSKPGSGSTFWFTLPAG